MSTTLRFPYNHAIPNAGQPELSQILTIASGVTSFPLGGAQAYIDVRAWKIAGEQTEAPYPCIVLEFSGNQSMTLGNGTTELIGLYGQIDLTNAPANSTERKRTLLAILGVGIGNNMPQIPLIQQAGPASDLVGFSQVVSNVAAYDRLSIGGVLGNVAFDEGGNVTVVARPIRFREYPG